MSLTASAARTVPDATDNIITTAELKAGGMSDGAIQRRCRPGGPWRRLLPGVVLLSPGEPTRRQMLRAVTRYLGPSMVITGLDALSAHGLELPRRPAVHVLAPTRRRMLAAEFVLLERTARMPEPVGIEGLTYAPAARAALDAARREHDPARLRDLLSLPIYYGLCTYEDLCAELAAGSQRGSAAVRTELRRIGRTRDTYVHGWARRLLRRTPLPPPRWNVTVCDRRGRPIGGVDAWWDEVGMGWQFTAPGRSGGKHLGHLALTAAGVVLVRTEPDRLRAGDDTVPVELASAFRIAATRARPPVQCEAPEVAA